MLDSYSNQEIVLFNSPLYRDKVEDGETYLPPLGQGYIITSLRECGIPAALVDCVYDRLSIYDIANIINQGVFPNIGFNIFSVNMILVKDILSRIERDVHIFLGGKAIAHLWKEILSWNIPHPITFIIGEGEKIFPALLKQECTEVPFFEDGFHMVYVVDKNSYYYPRNLDSVNLDRSLFKHREILNRYGRFEACIVASRGCIYDCAFCGGATSVNPNITPRTRGYGSLAKEINDIIQIDPNVRSIRILDDLFLRDRNSIINACTLFNSFPELHWRCMAHINTFIHHQDLMVDMKHSGCDEVFIGIESGSLEIRREIQKLGTPQEVIDIIRRLMTAGIDVKGYFMCGFPGETEEQLQETLGLSEELYNISKSVSGSFRPIVFQFRPYHGTKLFQQLFPDGTSIRYGRQAHLTSSKQQYNFSAGNFSQVNDQVLERYIQKIGHPNKRGF